MLTEVLGYTHHDARELTPADITIAGSAEHTALRIDGRPVPVDDDPRSCPACAMMRWLDTLGVADGLGRGSTRMALAAADAPTPLSPHQHQLAQPDRWRRAPVLLPAIDRHGWHDDYRP